MGYLQTTTGVTATGSGTTLSFITPICAQLAIQVVTSGTITATVEMSLDGVNFIYSGVTWSTSSHGYPSSTQSSGQIVAFTSQMFMPISAIRFNVGNISGSADISIAAAPLNSE